MTPQTSATIGFAFLAFVVLSIIWVGVDSRAVRRQYGADVGRTPTIGWVVVSTVVWIIGFPMYLWNRHKLVDRKPAGQPATRCAVCGAAPEPGHRFCTSCGSPVSPDAATSDRAPAAWFQRWPATVGGTVIAVVIGVAIAHQPAFGPHIDSLRLNDEIETTLARRGYSTVTVDCPGDQPARAGYTFVCGLDVNGQAEHVLVTVHNDRGDLNWMVTP